MIGSAETIAPPCTIFRPTPPHPNTASDWPILSLASLLIKPRAVVTAQPINAAISKSISFGMVVRRFSDTTATWLKVVTQPAFTKRVPHLYWGVCAWIPAPFRQCRTTWSPFRTRLTPGPVSRTTPPPSCPSKCGRNLSSPLTPAISPS